MGRNKKIVCDTCLRVMRKDTLKRHLKQHEKQIGKYEHESCATSTASSAASLDRDYESVSEFSSVSTSYKSTQINREVMIKKLETDDIDYKNKMEMGKTIYEIVKARDIAEESVCKEYKEFLDLFMKQKQNIDVENVLLRPWQASLLKHIKPSVREVIWVIGEKCNEGKTWFQEFIESKFGWSRVICGMDIKLKKSSICHALRKRSLVTTDIFLFDVGKAETFDGVNYEVLEKIKNGRILASKFDSTELKLNSPNTVVVFSNDEPDVKQLAKDRWVIFKINGDDLEYVSKKWK